MCYDNTATRFARLSFFLRKYLWIVLLWAMYFWHSYDALWSFWKSINCFKKLTTYPLALSSTFGCNTSTINLIDFNSAKLCLVCSVYLYLILPFIIFTKSEHSMAILIFLIFFFASLILNCFIFSKNLIVNVRLITLRINSLFCKW